MQLSLEKLNKFFKLESERGFDNRAVVGGLDKILPAWEAEARADGLPEEIIQTVLPCLRSYPELDPPARAASLRELWRSLQAKSAAQSNLNSLPDLNLAELPPSAARSEIEPSFPPRNGGDSHPPRAERSQALVNDIPHPRHRPQPHGRILPDGPVGLNAPLTVLSGIGPRHAQTLSQLGLHTLGDLLYFFPRRYDDFSQLKTISRLQYGEEVTVIGSVQSIVNRPLRGGQLQVTEAIITDGSGSLRVTWFNQPWLVNRLRPNTPVSLSGKIEQYLGRLVMNHPDWEQLDQELLHTNRIVPVYPLTANLNQRLVRRILHDTVSFWAPRIADFLPETIRREAGLIDLPNALRQIHFPDSVGQLEAARHRLAFDEIFLLQLGVLRQKLAWQSAAAQTFETPQEWLDAQINRLPFPLTEAQRRALAAVRQDLASGSPMNRLLQGDVGSGKTVIAALAIAMVARHGVQSALMAPTGILAEQHYRNLLTILAQGEGAPLQPAEIRLLVGDTPEAEKEDIRQGLAHGSIKLVVGTHALLEDPVTFQRLQLVVVDEQHRFGVSQRARLRSKGDNPHLLVMTATPIPRSLALTVYGDLDLTVMDEMPPGRQMAKTYVLSPRERERAYRLINAQISEGHQVFIIYPLVEQSTGDGELAAVEEYQRLQREVFPGYRVGLLHGRLKPEEKDEVMARFRDGHYHLLVSTSVVEVGVDVPNATVMLVEGANRFGLAQLHQFRGRVGRGNAQSFCLLIPDTEDAVENERLMVMAETNDGFVLAERDMQQRGPGEFLGTRQSGFSELRLANLTDVRLIEKAREQAQALFARDPGLQDPENQNLLSTLERFWSDGKGDIS